MMPACLLVDSTKHLIFKKGWAMLIHTSPGALLICEERGAVYKWVRGLGQNVSGFPNRDGDHNPGLPWCLWSISLALHRLWSRRASAPLHVLRNSHFLEVSLRLFRKKMSSSFYDSQLSISWHFSELSHCWQETFLTGEAWGKALTAVTVRAHEGSNARLRPGGLPLSLLWPQGARACPRFMSATLGRLRRGHLSNAMERTRSHLWDSTEYHML